MQHVTRYLLNEDGSKRYNFILLGYDKELNIIGFRPLTEEQKGSYPIRIDKNNSGSTISGRAFLKRFSIQHNVTQNYIVSWHEDEKMLTIELDEKYKKHSKEK